uniref:USP domain-containing protein n=1 Tax=Stegastes partitus TaxID=144197 RepID=A0A3B5B108_9TELE
MVVTCRQVEATVSGQINPIMSPPLCNEDLVCLGLPNLAQTCYMNSTLQSLLRLSGFIQEIYNHQQVWLSHSGSQVIRELDNVGVSRFSNNKMEKRLVLTAFKETVADFNSEFQDDSQKDAHEFLSCVLNMIHSLSSDLQMAAAVMGVTYICPVDAHVFFEMLNTRTCKGCGCQSMREEQYLNLSLVPAGSVSHSLQDYLKGSQLDFECSCGAGESTQQLSFLTLPNVLIIQLNRFRITSTFCLEKVSFPVELTRELVVNPENTITQTGARYSLVSIVSHLGSTAYSGHYICDSSMAHQALEKGDTSDRWLTYNDEHVTTTTGESVCQQRQRAAYLLFYEKQ